ncbi:MAG: ferritin family protein [Clostridia bacterium]
MKLLESKTYLNLAKAYAGECQAHIRYKFIEYGARNEGYVAMAELVDKVVYNEFNHARMLYSFIQTADEKTIENIDICSGYPFKEKWNLIDNLKLSAEDENNEATKIYPAYEKTARDEGFTDIANLFKNLIQVETCHKMLFEQLHCQMKSGTMYKKPTAVKWKCGGCGYEATSKEAFKVCPLCQAKQGVVMLKIEDAAN